MKCIIIINGEPYSGKDTFIKFFSKYVKTKNISSVDKVKEAAIMLGWNKEKDECGREFLSKLKKLSIQYFDHPYKYISDEIKKFKDSDNEVLFIHIREKEEIEKIVENFNAITVIVKGSRSQCLKSNPSDANVNNYKKYDYILYNEKDLTDLENKAKGFAKYLKENYND